MKLQDNLNNVWLYNYYGTSRIVFTKDRKSDHNGYKECVVNARYHNTKGPAIILSDATKLFYFNYKYLTEKEWHNATQR